MLDLDLAGSRQWEGPTYDSDEHRDYRAAVLTPSPPLLPPQKAAFPEALIV